MIKNSKTTKVMLIMVCLLFVTAGLFAAPAKPTLQIINDAFGGTSFEVIWNLYWGEQAEQWELWEDDGSGFSKIHGPVAAAASSSTQTDRFAVTTKSYGIYKYKVKLINTSGETWSDPASHVVGGASKIEISPATIDLGKQAFQFTQALGTATYDLSCMGITNPVFIVSTNNEARVDVSVAGTTLTVNAKLPGRAGIKIIETGSGITRHVGVRIKNANGSLPGMPNYLSIGSVGTNVDRDMNYVKDFLPGDKNKRMDIRYIYLNGEPDSWDRGTDGWQKWGANQKGHRAFTYIRENQKLGIIPFFVYYTICGSNESYQTDLANIQDVAHLGYYFKDLKFTLDLIKSEAGGDLVGMIFEPDFIGYMMQQSGKMPNEIYANTKLVYETAYGGENAAGALDSTVDVDPSTGQPFADNLQGLIKAINFLVSKYEAEGCNIEWGWQFNTWANPAPGVPSKGLMHKTDDVGIAAGRQFIRDRAQETADYYMAAGILEFGADFISIDKYGKDAASFAGDTDPAGHPENSTWFFNADHWNNYLAYIDVLNNATGKPVVLWQMPVGHIERSQEPDPYDGGLFDPLTNTKNGAECSYEDSTVTFFFGDIFKPGSTNRYDWFAKNESNDPLITNMGDTVTWGAHWEAAKNAGIYTALFGAGVGEATHGNVSDVSQATEPEDDSWFFVKTQRYLKNPVSIDITPGPTPTVTPIVTTTVTPTPTPTATGTAIVTPTPTYTPTVTPTATSTSVVTPTPTNTATNTPTPTTTPDNTGCTYPAWIPGNTYTNETVHHNGHDWKAQWWTTAEPGTTGQWGAWKDLGVCNSDSTPTPTPTATNTPVVTPTNTPVVTPTNTPVVTPTNTATPTATNTAVPTPTQGTGPAAWAAGTAYVQGDLVTYSGSVYKCLQPHTALLGWEPANVPSLWQKQ